MRHPFITAVTGIAILASTACDSGGGSSTPSDSATTGSATYNATASVGDFITVDLDRDAGTIAYQNHSNGDSGTASYTVDANGVYQITDPDGRMLEAVEIPGFALIVQSDQVGRDKDEQAILTAVQSEPVTVDQLAGNEYNYIEFSTTSGINLGHASFASTGLTLESYDPVQAMIQAKAVHEGWEDAGEWGEFNTQSMDASLFANGPDNRYISIEEEMTFPGPDGPVTETAYTYMFGTSSGVFAVDTPMGSVIGVAESDSKDFKTAWAGTYQAYVYSKDAYLDFPQDSNPTEVTEYLGIERGVITVSADGVVDIVDAADNIPVVSNAALVPLADDTDVYDGTSARLGNPCHGLFSVELPDQGPEGYTQTLYVAFMDDAMVFGAFTVKDVTIPNYTYLYGFGVRTAADAATGDTAIMPGGMAARPTGLPAMGAFMP
ncbi:MAG: hypothetical protein ACOCXJ_01410 [Planctomycetota bacterium]